MRAHAAISKQRPSGTGFRQEQRAVQRCIQAGWRDLKDNDQTMKGKRREPVRTTSRLQSPSHLSLPLFLCLYPHIISFIRLRAALFLALSALCTPSYRMFTNHLAYSQRTTSSVDIFLNRTSCQRISGEGRAGVGGGLSTEEDDDLSPHIRSQPQTAELLYAK